MEVDGEINWQTVGKKQVIRIKNLIGEGVQSKIYRGAFQRKLVAVKSMLFDGDTREVDILRNLDHPNIIRIHFTDVKEKTLYIVLELCSCTLKEYVEQCREIRLSSIQVLQQITEGLDYLHNGQKHCTVHRDLKPSNILFQYIDRDDEWRVKISDFGISKEFTRGKTSTESTLKGTFGYVAPELLYRADGSKGPGKIRKATDIFSLGVIFYYVLSDGRHPFSNDSSVVNAKIRDEKPVLEHLRSEYEDIASGLILSMIHKEYKSRVHIREVKSHPIFWIGEKKADFFQKVSDYLEDRSKHQTLIGKIEKAGREITGGCWKDRISCENPEMKRVIEKKKGWEKKKSVQDLLRLIRNWIHHYHDSGTTQELRNELGDCPDGIVNFFTSSFPKLLPYLYEIMNSEKSQTLFAKFYGQKVSHVTYENKEQEITDCVMEDAALMNEAERLGTPPSSDAMEVDSADDDSMEEHILTSDEEEENDKSVSPGDSKLVLREYQKELAEQALSGHNSLIIAPTGSGKTAVAYEIIRNHLREGNARSILFLVSKTTLARQQYEFFSRHLRDILKVTEIAYLIGENTTNISAGALIKNMKLTILTPQILIDELNRSKSFISFHDISMMIFDECHNATKKHPYKVIMDMALDFCVENPNHHPIQIVGMTASPGVGKGKTREKVMENLITLLANLNVKLCPALVDKNKDELKQHQNQIEESYVRVEIKMDKFTTKILKAMKIIEGLIEDEGIFGSEAGQVMKPPQDKDKQKYENWVMDLIRHVKVKEYDSEILRVVSIYASHLKMYHHLLYLKKLIPNAMDATDGLAEFNQEGRVGNYLRKINAELRKISSDAEVPMLQTLFGILKKEFEKNKESRCIIFVPRRSIAPALVNCMMRNQDIAQLQPKSLTGSNEHAAMGGMTKSEQENSMTAFRDGSSKILIATSVAEEGLDIRACNLVIMYNYVTGEVGRIQRAGRGRAENSRSILITPYGGEQVEREKMNIICAHATEVAMQDLKEFSEAERVSWIKAIQKRQRQERLAQSNDEKKLLQQAHLWKILCGQCGAHITTADKIRHIKHQHRFVVDPTFRERVTRNPCEPTPIAPGLPYEQVATFSCRNNECMHHLGVEMQHKGKVYPTLSVKKLIFQERETGDRVTRDQWSKCPFAVEKEVDEPGADEADPKKVLEFAVSQAKSLSKGFLPENISTDEAKEVVAMANSTD